MYRIASYIQKDVISLRQYIETLGEVSWSDIKNNLFSLQHYDNLYVPDHYIKLSNNYEMQDINSVNDLLCLGFVGYCNSLLEYRNDTVIARAETFNQWQMNIVSISPLLAISAMLEHKFTYDSSNPISFLSNYIIPNIRHTTIPSPYIIQTEKFLHGKNGLCDLHAHLNGTLESDAVWQDFLAHPYDVLKEINKKYQNATKEQFCLLYPGLTPDLFFHFLQIANAIRASIYDLIVEQNNIIPNLLSKIISGDNSSVSLIHPVEHLVGNGYTSQQLEALFYVIVFNYLRKNKNEAISKMFHLYILIMGLSNSMLVQQNNLFGFEQFNKYTQNGCREWSESAYLRRFKQLAGNHNKFLSFYEGRFAPKKTIYDNIKILKDISTGWKEFCNVNNSNAIGFGLIAHFIKSKDNSQDNIYFLTLREDTKHKAEILSDLIYSHNPCVEKLVGVDAAGNELDAPPEVFVESYNIMRDAGINHFTFHAGEDFYHIISGIRAVYEAIIFLKLQKGDRIGHAVACGVDPELWVNNIALDCDYVDNTIKRNSIKIRQGEYLDNLIFLHHLIADCSLDVLSHKLPHIDNEILKYGDEIYSDGLDSHNMVHEYVQSWLNRGNVDLEWIKHHVYDATLKSKYYQRKYANNYSKPITIQVYDVLDANEIKVLQRAVLQIMHNKEIVIETVPTSNVLIGHHKSFSSYHLYNWYCMEKVEKLPMPPIVVGTDDAGIFDTNIYNEYCNIYCMFLYDKKLNHSDIMEYLEELDSNARLYGFTKM